MTAHDIRFVKKGDAVYAFCMGWPEQQAVIEPLGTRAGAGKIRNVELLGFSGKLNWKQAEHGLTVQMPAQKPSDHAIAFKVIGA
jgi:alpha-L-fucosidase